MIDFLLNMDFLRKVNSVMIVILFFALVLHTYRMSKWISREPAEDLPRDRRILWTHAVMLLVTTAILSVISLRTLPANPSFPILMWLFAYNMPLWFAGEIARNEGKLDRSLMRFSSILSLIALPIFIISLIWPELSPSAVTFVTFSVIASGIAIVQHNYRALALKRAQAQPIEQKGD